MRLELMPDLVGQGLKWSIQFCLRVPPSAAPIVPVGMPAVLICRLKILFFVSLFRCFPSLFIIFNYLFYLFILKIQITRLPYMPNMDWKDQPSLVLPMVYDVNSNITQLAERREQQLVATNAVSHQLRRFADYGVQPNECSLFPAIRDLLANLVLPPEVCIYFLNLINFFMF